MRFASKLKNEFNLIIALSCPDEALIRSLICKSKLNLLSILIPNSFTYGSDLMDLLLIVNSVNSVIIITINAKPSPNPNPNP